MRLPVLMFDFGNVVAFFDYAVMFERLGRRLGIAPGELQTLMFERGAAELARQFELGQLEPEEFAQRVLGLVGRELPFAEFEADWPDIFSLNLPVVGLIARLEEAGYTLLLGSNTNVLHARFYRRRFKTALGAFDHFVFSYEVGAMKPDRAFFAACLDAVGVPAESCVFIDDAEANVAGARAAGLKAVHYRDPASLIHDLRELGVEVPGHQA